MEDKNHKEIGNRYEDLAVEYLKKEGFQILTRNFRSKFGEVDIIASENEYLCFVEVKYRSTRQAGFPEEAVSYGKMKKISKTALFYMTRHKIPTDRPIRFDVIAIEENEIRLTRNAFPFVG